MRYTLKDIERLAAAGKIQGYTIKQTADAKKRNKYGNKKIEWNDMLFDSKKELARYQELLVLQKVGEISELRRQVVYELWVEGKLVCVYVADHVYKDKAGVLVVEDVKSKATRKIPLYRLKKKLMLSIHKIEIKEV